MASKFVIEDINVFWYPKDRYRLFLKGEDKKINILKNSCFKLVRKHRNITQIDIVRFQGYRFSNSALGYGPPRSILFKPWRPLTTKWASGRSRDISFKELYENILEEVADPQKLYFALKFLALSKLINLSDLSRLMNYDLMDTIVLHAHRHINFRYTNH